MFARMPVVSTSRPKDFTDLNENALVRTKMSRLSLRGHFHRHLVHAAKDAFELEGSNFASCDTF